MTDSQRRMLEAFAEYERSREPTCVGPNHNMVGMPMGSRLLRIYKYPDKWRLWIATNDFIYGTYLELYHNGTVTRTTTRRDEGDEIILVRPRDEEVNK